MGTMDVFYERQASSIIRGLTKRGMEGYYAKDAEVARAKALELIPENASVAWGGSVTLGEIGLDKAVFESGRKVIDRSKAATPEEKKAIYREMFSADCFLMSANAVTIDGELVNIDGTGNRVACLCYGPDSVIVVAGMNKVVPDVDAGIKRVQEQASAPNCIRLDLQTPCSVTGKCGHCLGQESICSQIVVTRLCKPKGRIKVILVGGSFGY